MVLHVLIDFLSQSCSIVSAKLVVSHEMRIARILTCNYSTLVKLEY